MGPHLGTQRRSTEQVLVGSRAPGDSVGPADSRAGWGRTQHLESPNSGSNPNPITHILYGLGQTPAIACLRHTLRIK